jgi:hypothetical protein
MILLLRPLVSAHAQTLAAPSSGRYAVAHVHALTQCVGYLEISTDRIRYEVVKPESDKKHSFDLARTDIQAIQQWAVLGVPQNAVEIKATTGNYHFWLLPDTADLVRTQPTQWGARSAAPVATLLAALTGAPMPEPPATPAVAPAAGTPGVAPTTAAAPGYPVSGTAMPDPAAATAPAIAPAASAPPMPNVVGPNSLSEYVYTAPQGWTRMQYSNGIVINSPTYNTGERCLISLWPFRQAGANLINDAASAFQTIFSTYQFRDGNNDGVLIPTVLSRGTSGQGWDYVMIKRGIGKPPGPGGQRYETLQGFVFVAKLNSNLAVISGISKAPLVSSCLGELVGDVWPKFFYSLRFRDWPVNDQSAAMMNKLAGTWSAATATAGTQFVFAPNGRYDSAAAAQQYNLLANSQVLTTTQAYFGNGAYSINQNSVILMPDNRPREPAWFRLEEESKDGGRTWTTVLSLLRISSVDGKDYEVRYLKH